MKYNKTDENLVILINTILVMIKIKKYHINLKFLNVVHLPTFPTWGEVKIQIFSPATPKPLYIP